MTEEGDTDIDEFKYLNINRFDIMGTQVHIYPVYKERDLLIENDIEIFIINIADFKVKKIAKSNVTKSNK